MRCSQTRTSACPHPFNPAYPILSRPTGIKSLLAACCLPSHRYKPRGTEGGFGGGPGSGLGAPIGASAGSVKVGGKIDWWVPLPSLGNTATG